MENCIDNDFFKIEKDNPRTGECLYKAFFLMGGLYLDYIKKFCDAIKRQVTPQHRSADLKTVLQKRWRMNIRMANKHAGNAQYH